MNTKPFSVLGAERKLVRYKACREDRLLDVSLMILDVMKGMVPSADEMEEKQ